MSTAHERYENQVKTGHWLPYNDLHIDNLQKQLDAVLAERNALRMQVAALVEDRALLRAEIDELRTANTDPFDLASLDDGTAFAFEVSAARDNALNDTEE